MFSMRKGLAMCAHPVAGRSARWRYPSVRRLRVAILTLCLVAILPWLDAHLVSQATASGSIYSVAALEARLARNPAALLHRSVRVRAQLGGQCTAVVGLYTRTCTAWRVALTDQNAPADPQPDGYARPLPLAWGEASPILAFLRRLPLVRQMIPPPQILHSGVPAIYQIDVQPTTCVLSADPPCYQARLLDAIAPNNSAASVRMGS